LTTDISHLPTEFLKEKYKEITSLINRLQQLDKELCNNNDWSYYFCTQTEIIKELGERSVR